MAQTNVNIRMDEGLKQDFEWLCTELGLNMTTAFNVFARAVVRSRKIPFAISLEAPNAETLAAIDEVRQAKKNPDKKLYADFSELLNEVEANDLRNR